MVASLLLSPSWKVMWKKMAANDEIKLEIIPELY